ALSSIRRRSSVLVRSAVAISKNCSLCTVGVLLLATLLACSTQQNVNNSAQTSSIVIGSSIANSGDFSADGKPTQQGYQLWADSINKHGGLLGRQARLDLINDNRTTEADTGAHQKLMNVP